MDKKQQTTTGDSISTIALIDRDPIGYKQTHHLRWWYRIAAPPAPSVMTSLDAREEWRHGQYISHILLIMICIFLFLSIVIGGFITPALLPDLLLAVLVLSISTIFNRRGQIIISGLLIVLALDASIMATFLAFNTFSSFLLPMLDLLIIPELFAASLLPPRFAFLDMYLHIVFCICALIWMFPKDAALAAILHNPVSMVDALARPIILQIITAIIALTWRRNVNKSVERVNRAISIALLEHHLAEQVQKEAEHKRLLESEIRTIIEVHRQLANGNLNAHVPLETGHILWPLAGSLNNLIARFRNLLREFQQIKRIDTATLKFYKARERAQNGPIPWESTGTSVDALVKQHNMFASTTASRKK